MKRTPAVLIIALAFACAPKGEDSGSGETAGDSSGDGDGDVPAACVAAGWDTSLAAYETLAEQADGTYWYAVYTSEYINSDFQWSCLYRTTVEVVMGTPARRAFELAEVADDTLPEECTGVPFIEEGAEVGTMAGGLAFYPYTMEQLYSGCCDLLALEPEDMYSDYFEVDANGVVAGCFTTENNCGEGCEGNADGFVGFRLEPFGFGSPP